MWFAVAIFGIIGLATGITLLPHANPDRTPPAAAASAPASTTPAPTSPSDH